VFITRTFRGIHVAPSKLCLYERLQVHKAKKVSGRFLSESHTMSIVPRHSEESILELIGLIYDSALDPHHWVALMRRMTEILKGSSALVGVLMPHLQRAFELHMRMQGLGSKGNAAADALNHLQEGVILLDARGLVLFANDAADLTLRQEKALKLTPTGIRAMSPLEDKKLARLVAEAITTGSGRGFQAVGTMTIELEFPRRFLHLSVIPLRSHAIQFGKASPVAAIFLAEYWPGDLGANAVAGPALRHDPGGGAARATFGFRHQHQGSVGNTEREPKYPAHAAQKYLQQNRCESPK
jgi:hypothetical protein